jgi:hypothetical protein
LIYDAATVARPKTAPTDSGGTSGHRETSQLRRHALRHGQDTVIIECVGMFAAAIHRQVSFAVEDSVVVDDDFCIGHHRLRTAAVKCVRIVATCRNRSADARFAAWTHVALARYAATPGATCCSRTARATRRCCATIAALATAFTTSNQRHNPQRADTHESE